MNKNQFKEVEYKNWPENMNDNVYKLYMSSHFLVQRLKKECDIIQFKITRINKRNLDWSDEIPRKVISQIKLELGFSSYFAVEVYPKYEDLIDDDKKEINLFILLKNKFITM